MNTFPVPANESERLQALCQYNILDTESEKAFDDLAQLAARICHAPTALVSLVDANRQWFKSRVGVDIHETPRDIAFCGYTILGTTPLVISDALKDERFSTNPLVTGPPYIRFYAGVPLITSDGYALGSLCVIDDKPRGITNDQLETLQVLSRQVVAQLELRRHLLEAADQESRVRFQQVADSAPILIWVDDLKQHTTFLNHYWSQLVDLLEGDALQETWTQLIHADDVRLRAERYEHAFQTQQSYTVEYRIKARGGDRWLLETGIPRFLPDGTFDGLTGSCVDISDRKEAESHLQHAHAELVRVTQLKDAFLANMNHELRTPLNAILGMSEALREEVWGALNTGQAKAVSSIERGGEKLLTLINDILDVSIIESDLIELDPAPTPMKTLCLSCVEAVQHKAAQEQIQLQSISHCGDRILTVDPQRISQVLMNLLNNAIKFTPAGGCVTLEMTESREGTPDHPSSQSSTFLQISVHDTGIGIAPEHLDALFQPFSQIETSLRRRYAGLGLGLYFAKRIVELHHGYLAVKSQVNAGSCFTVKLPI
jgi:PAS domain S-box-containing protein